MANAHSIHNFKFLPNLFFKCWQAVWVWTVSLPVTIVNASDRNPSLQAVDIVGWIMWTIGFLIEATADQEKLSFKNSPENRGKWCDVGLWKYSRHPNYFGEVGFASMDNLLSATVVIDVQAPIYSLKL